MALFVARAVSRAAGSLTTTRDVFLARLLGRSATVCITMGRAVVRVAIVACDSTITTHSANRLHE